MTGARETNDLVPQETGAASISRVVIAPRSAPTMAEVIREMVLRDDISTDKLDKLIAMQERMEDRQRALAKEDAAEAARVAYDAAMAAARAEIKPVARNKRNETTRSNFSDLAAIALAIDPIITKHGFTFTCVPVGTTKPDHFGMHYRNAHIAGHAVEDTVDVPSTAKGAKGGDVMTGMHAFGSALSYGRRYLKCAVYDVATADDDGNKGGGAVKADPLDEPMTAEQFVIIQRLIDQAKPDMAKFLEHFCADRVEFLNQRAFRDASDLLRRRIAEAAKTAKASADA